MKLYSELSTKVLVDLDLQFDAQITPDELAGYFNDAIGEAEAAIHKLNCEEDYFLTRAPLYLQAGVSEYELSCLAPNLYAQKLRGVIYAKGGLIYPIKRIRRYRQFLKAADLEAHGSATRLAYMLVNDITDPATNDPTNVMVFYPTPAESGEVGKIWYIRAANRVPMPSVVTQVVADKTKIDIPAFESFIMASVKRDCLSKKGDPRYDIWEAKAASLKQDMVNTLTPQVVDDDDTIQPDLSLYEEMN